MVKLDASVRLGSLKGENEGRWCEACRHEFESSIQLTNLADTSLRTYSACPFCFSKLTENLASQELDGEAELMSSRKSETVQGDFGSMPKGPEKCPHSFGYLKKRPKGTQIPDTCLTCQKMIQCVL